MISIVIGIILVVFFTVTLAMAVISPLNMEEKLGVLSLGMSLIALGISLIICGNHKLRVDFGKEKKLEGYNLAIFALSFAFVIPLVTYICGGIAYSKAKEQLKEMPEADEVKNLSSIAMIITSVVIVLSILLKHSFY